MAEADVVVKSRYESDASQGVPIEPRAVLAEWRGDEVTIWSSTQVPYAARDGRRADLADPRGERPGGRPAAGRRVRREVRSALRGAGRRTRARRAPPGAAGLLPRGGVPRDRAAPRGDRDGVRDRGDAGRAPGRAQGAARPGQGRVLRRGRVPRADGRDARVRPVRDRRHLRGVVPQLHEPAAVGLGAGAHRSAGVLGPRAAHGRGREGARHRSGGAPPAHADRGGRGGSDAPDLRRDRREADTRARRRDDRRTSATFPRTRRSASPWAGGPRGRRLPAPTST